jgi:hypothetical protein
VMNVIERLEEESSPKGPLYVLCFCPCKCGEDPQANSSLTRTCVLQDTLHSNRRGEDPQGLISPLWEAYTFDFAQNWVLLLRAICVLQALDAGSI